MKHLMRSLDIFNFLFALKSYIKTKREIKIRYSFIELLLEGVNNDSITYFPFQSGSTQIKIKVTNMDLNMGIFVIWLNTNEKST